MSFSTQNNCNVERAVAYTVYSVGASVLVGLVRVIVAIAYIVKHALNAHVAATAQQIRDQKARAEREADQDQQIDKSMDRFRENRAATSATKKAKGLDKAAAWAGEKLTKAKNALGEAKDELIDEGREAMRVAKRFVGKKAVYAFVKTERQMMSEWQAELVRGLAEMSIVGSILFTYKDNFAGKRVSVFSFAELRGRIENEKAADALIQQFVSP